MNTGHLPLRRLHDDAEGTTSYIAFACNGKEALAIDPAPAQSNLILAMLAERRVALRYVLRTHTHHNAPHAASENPCDALCAQTGAQLVSAQSGAGMQTEDRMRLPFGQDEILVIATPGHSADSVCFLWQDRLFCGDSLLIGACADPMPDTDPGRQYDSVTQRLFALPGEILVYPGRHAHGASVSSIADERLGNPAFASTRADFIHQANHVRGLLSHTG